MDQRFIARLLAKKAFTNVSFGTTGYKFVKKNRRPSLVDPFYAQAMRYQPMKMIMHEAAQCHSDASTFSTQRFKNELTFLPSVFNVL